MENPKSKRDKKATKEPEVFKAKRARTAYILFGMSVRESIAKEGLANTDIMRRIGELWKAASEETKGKFNKMAEEEKARVEKESK